MAELFDSYRSNYRDVVQSSIDFSGLSHSFFMRAKPDLLRELMARRPGPEKPAMLDVGCGVGSFHPLLRGMVGSLSGIDVSPARSRRRAPTTTTSTTRLRRQQLRRRRLRSGDAICVLHHVAPPEWAHFANDAARCSPSFHLRHRANPLNPLTLAVARCGFDRNAILPAPAHAEVMAAGGLPDRRAISCCCPGGEARAASIF